MVLVAHMLGALAALGGATVRAAPAPGPGDSPDPLFYHRDDGRTVVVGGGEGNSKWEAKWDAGAVCAGDVHLGHVVNADGLETNMNMDAYVVQLEAATPAQRLDMTERMLRTLDTSPLGTEACYRRMGRKLENIAGVLYLSIVSAAMLGIATPALHFYYHATTETPVEQIVLARGVVIIAAAYTARVLATFATLRIQGNMEGQLRARDAATIALMVEVLHRTTNGAVELMAGNARTCITAGTLATVAGALAKTDNRKLLLTSSDKSTARGPECPNLPFHD